ncbi:MAG: FlgD immunoglobulin-like domain containing protein, partial [bacterium]
TGDGISFGDSGMRFDGSNVGGTLEIFVRNFYLPAGTTIAGLNAAPADSALGALLADQAFLPLSIGAINTQQFDLIPPARISDLGVVQKTTDSMTLAWTAPGDDSTSGKASQYTLYFDATAVGADTAAWIQNARVDNNIPSPGDPNTLEQYTVGGLIPQQPYYFILIASDEFGNRGGYSNVATEITVPIELAELAAMATGNAVHLSWRTVSETSNAGFAIERRTEVDENGWIEIAFIAGDGTSLEPQSYSHIDEVAAAGVYFYRLRQVDLDGNFTYSGEIRVQVSMPESIALVQNYPNPFKLGTPSIIRYTLPERSNNFVSVKIYNLIGQEIGILFSGQQNAGYHQIAWDGRLSGGRQATAGVYFLVLEAAGSRVIRKIAILP